MVTGAGGFLGRHVLAELARSQPQLRRVALVRDPMAWGRQSWVQAVDPVEALVGSVSAPEAWAGDPRLAGVQAIVHAAGRVAHSRRPDPATEITNVAGTIAMVDVAARIGARLVFVSTSGTVACFGSPEARADESAPYCEAMIRRWPYYMSKLRAEREATALARARGVEFVVLRPPVLLGPGDHRFRSTANVLRFLRGRLPFLIRGGIAFVDVRDAARSAVASALHDSPRPCYHLPGANWTLRQFFETLGALSGTKVPAVVLPYRVAHTLACAGELFGSWRPGSSTTSLPDPVVIEMGHRYWGLTSLHAEHDLGHGARPPAETLEDTVAWLRRAHPALMSSTGP